VCHSRNWSVAGLETAMPFNKDNTLSLFSGQIHPVVAIICDVCAFVRHFAWLHIKPPVGVPGGGGNG
jgi:hypothetical protein